MPFVDAIGSRKSFEKGKFGEWLRWSSWMGISANQFIPARPDVRQFDRLAWWN